MSGKMHKWEVRSLDVWGNAKDGFEVHDSRKIQTIVLSEDFTDKELLDALKDGACLRSHVRLSQLAIDGDDATINIDEAKNGRPVFTLYRQYGTEFY